MLFTKGYKFKKVPSTNNTAFELARKGAQEGEYVVAEQQTQGRGRLNRKWVSKPGNLYVSLILRPPILSRQAQHLTFVAALAAMKTLEKYLSRALQLKWPNDVLVDGKKISGILTELEAQTEKVDFVIVGIGININQEKFPKSLLSKATSLYLIQGKVTPVDQVLDDLLISFEEWYQSYLEKGFPLIRETWEELSLIKGRAVEVKEGRKKKRGVALGLDNDGALIIKTPQGETQHIYSGDLTCF